MPRLTPGVPLKIGQLAWGYGLEFKCQGCGRGRGYDRDDLLLKWGEEGRVQEIAAKHACSNCKAKNPRRRPGVRVRVFRTHSRSLKALSRTPVDRLATAIKDLVVRGRVS